MLLPGLQDWCHPALHMRDRNLISCSQNQWQMTDVRGGGGGAPRVFPTVNLRCRPLPFTSARPPSGVQPPPGSICQPGSGTSDNMAFNNRADVLTFTGPNVNPVHLSPTMLQRGPLDIGIVIAAWALGWGGVVSIANDSDLENDWNISGETLFLFFPPCVLIRGQTFS